MEKSMRTAWIGLLALAFVVPCPARGQVARPTPEEFRSGFNRALGDRGLKMKLDAWSPEESDRLCLTAPVTPNIRAFAHLDDARRVSSVLLLMHASGTVESIVQIIAAVAATTYAANPELPQEDRERLFAELGLYDPGWSLRGLDGIALREGRTYRVIHPGGDPLIVALVSWAPGLQPANPFVF
jgi:hypothetical protein